MPYKLPDGFDLIDAPAPTQTTATTARKPSASAGGRFKIPEGFDEVPVNPGPVASTAAPVAPAQQGGDDWLAGGADVRPDPNSPIMRMIRDQTTTPDGEPSWRRDANSEIASRESGRQLTKVRENPDGSSEYEMVQATPPRKLSNSEKLAILDAYRVQRGMGIDDQGVEQGQGMRQDAAGVRAATIADNSVLQNFSGAAADTMAQTGAGLVGVVDPDAGNRLAQDAGHTYAYDPESKAAFAGQVVGNTLPLVPALAGGGALAIGAKLASNATASVLALSQFGQVRNQVNEARRQGQQISVEQEFAGAALSAAAELIGEKIGLDAISNAAQKAALGPIKQAILTYAGSMGVNATEEYATDIAQQAVETYILQTRDRYDPTQSAKAALAGALVGGVATGAAQGFNRIAEGNRSNSGALDALNPVQQADRPAPAAASGPKATEMAPVDVEQPPQTDPMFEGAIFEDAVAVTQGRDATDPATDDVLSVGRPESQPPGTPRKSDEAEIDRIRRAILDPYTFPAHPPSPALSPNDEAMFAGATFEGPAGDVQTQEGAAVAGSETGVEAIPVVKRGDDPTVPAPPPSATVDDLVKYIQTINTGEFDPEATRQLLGTGNYVLRDIPVDRFGPVFGPKSVDKGRVDKFAGDDAAGAPPIVAGQMDGKGPLRPIDGKHRLLAARKRGDATIRAYVPERMAARIDRSLGTTAPGEVIQGETDGNPRLEGNTAQVPGNTGPGASASPVGAVVAGQRPGSGGTGGAARVRPAAERGKAVGGRLVPGGGAAGLPDGPAGPGTAGGTAVVAGANAGEVEGRGLRGRTGTATKAGRGSPTPGSRAAGTPGGEQPTAANRPAGSGEPAGDGQPASASGQRQPRVTPQVEPEKPAGESKNPAVRLASQVEALIREGKSFTSLQLYKLANDAYGGTQSEGKYQGKDAFEAVELAVNRAILADPSIDPGADLAGAKVAIAKLEAMKAKLPTATRRGDNTDKFQQFSTPPDYAYAAAWVANLTPADRVLEPSAGTGSLAVFTIAAGATPIANEIDARRADALEEGLRGVGKVSREDAEQLGNILDAGAADVVVMNPPFSRAGNRLGDKMSLGTAGRHINAALDALAPGGRVVAIVGEGMTIGAPRYRDFYKGLAGKGAVLRANVEVSGDVYAKYGTSFGTRLLVIDKAPAGDAAVVTGKADDIAGLVDLLQEVRDARTSQPTTSEPRGAQGAVEAGEPADGRPAVRAATDERGAGERPVEDRAVPALSPERGSGPVVEPQPGQGDESNVPGLPAGERTGQPDAGGRPDDSRVALARTVAAVESPALAFETQTPEKAGAITDAVFEPYKPRRLKIVGAVAHPTPLVESAAMSSVNPPTPTYKPKLAQRIISEGILSDAQIENVVYAGQAHQEILDSGERAGYAIGDGTGVGKGRQIAAIVLDNWNQGRKKHLWVTETPKLFGDTKRDVAALAGDEITVHNIAKTKIGDKIPHAQGVLFLPYGTLRSEKGKRTRLDQIVEWLGEGFDGTINFDEAHNLKSAISTKGKRGMTKPSDTALAAAELQKRLPLARVVYISATMGSEAANLGFATRLGLWGQGTSFENAQKFVGEIEAAGTSGMELVARDMKAMGRYMARSLSFDGVEYERLEHTLTAEQTRTYDKIAEAYAVILKNINAALEITATDESGKVSPAARSSAMSAFWGNNQRVFNQIITSMQMPSILKSADAKIAAGEAVVFQLVNTAEALTDDAMSARDEEADLESLDLSPKASIIGLVEKAFPVQQYEAYTDEDGNERMRPVKKADGSFVVNKEAAAMRDRLIDDLASLRVPDPALDQILRHFGTDRVAENTGRSRRLVNKMVEGQMKRTEEPWSQAKALADVAAFQDDKKQALVFSQAGGTGASYHSDKNAKNQRRRNHYLVQPGWMADKAVQGFGRSHRSNQFIEPLFILPQTNVKGQKRFISTIARRLSGLGALTKGQREASGQGMFSQADNLESTEAKDALRRLLMGMTRGDVQGFTEQEFSAATGLALRDKDGNIKQELPPVPQFLNRMLALPIEQQNRLFDAFDATLRGIIEQKSRDGTLDVGVQSVKADKVKKLDDQVAYTDPKSGAETHYVRLELQHKARPNKFSAAAAIAANGEFVQNVKSGRVYAVSASHFSTDTRTGAETQKYRRLGVLASSYIDQSALNDREKYTILDKAAAEQLWKSEVTALPDFTSEDLHMITGAMLPIWDKLARSNPRVYQMVTDDGERLLGRVIPDDELETTLARLGVKGESANVTPAAAGDGVMDDGRTLTLGNDWTLRTVRAGGSPRVEIEGPGGGDVESLTQMGVQKERFGYTNRFFVPAGDEGKALVAKLADRYGILSIVGKKKGGGAGDAFDAPARRTPKDTGARIDDDSLDAVANPTVPRTPVAPLPGGTPKPLHRIITDFATALDKFPRLGQAKRGTAGNYFPASTRTNIRHANDLDTVAHELAGHFVDDQHGVLADWAKARTPSPYDAELIPVFSQHGSGTKSGPKSTITYKRAEGLAEWVRAWIVNPKAADAAAPTFAAFFKSKVASKTLDAIEAYSRDVRQFAGMSPTLRTAANINLNPQPRATVMERIKSAAVGAGDTLRNEFSDEFAPIHKAVAEAIRVRDDLPKLAYRNDPSLLLRLYSGEDGVIEEAIENGVPKAFDRTAGGEVVRAEGVEGGLDWLLQPVVGASLAETDARMQKALAYLVNRRVAYKADQWLADADDQIKALDPADPKLQAKSDAIRARAEARTERMAGTGGGLTSDAQQARDSLIELEADPDLPAFKVFAERYEAWGDGLLRYLVDKGRKSEQWYDELKIRNEVYADLHRVADEFEPDAGVGGRKIGATAEPVKMFKGSTRTIENPLVNLIRQTSAIINEADRNYVREQFNTLLVYPRGMYEGAPRDLDKIGSKAPNADGKNTIKTFVDGEPQFWQYRDDVYKAMKQVGQVRDLGTPLKLVSLAVKGISRNLITRAPSFVIKQVMFKDPVQRAIVSDVNSGLFANWGSFTKAERDSLRASGGTVIGAYMGGRNWHKWMQKRLRALSGERGSIVSTAGDFLAGADNWMTELSDGRTRLAEYRAAYDAAILEGNEPYDAALFAAGQARGLIDYAQMGRTIRRVSPFVLFLNPAIKGPERFAKALLRDVRNIRNAPNNKTLAATTIARWGMYVLAPRLGFALLRSLLGQEDEYDRRLAQWRKDFCLNIKLFGRWVSIPQPYEMGVLGAGVERAINFARGREHAFEGYVGSVLASLVPIDEVIIGGAARAMLENTANYNFFFQRQIVPAFEEGLDLSLREGTKHSSRLGQLLQDATGYDARKIENLLYSMGGGVTNLGLALSDVGRDDKEWTRLFDAAIGLTTSAHPMGGRDVQWVLNESQRLGRARSIEIKPLMELVKAYNSAEDAATRDEAAKAIGEVARDIRLFYEQNGTELLESKQPATE